MYDLNDDQWELNSAITHSNPTESGDDLGNSVAMHQGRIIAGALGMVAGRVLALFFILRIWHL